MNNFQEDFNRKLGQKITYKLVEWTDRKHVTKRWYQDISEMDDAKK